MKNNICLVATYTEFAQLARELKQELDLPIDVLEGSLEEGTRQAVKAEKAGAKIIISRGGTASMIRRHVKIPVVEIRITGFDIFRNIYPVSGPGRVLGLLGYKNAVTGCRAAAQVLGISIHEIILADGVETDWEDVRSRVKYLMEEHGVNTFIGDTSVLTHLEFPTLDVRLITSGRESILPAVEDAMNLLRVQEEEQKATQRLQAILNFVHDGIMATDESGNITLLNPVAEKIFHVSQSQVLGKKINKVITETRIDEVLKSGQDEIGQLQKAPEGHILTNRIPINVNGVVKGVVATFQEVTRIQDAERTIRQSLYGKGLVTKYKFNDILTNDSRMKNLIEIARGYSLTGATVLIQGESGTGKELFSQSIHASSPRSQGPFVAVNCAALPSQLLESELFGYVEGAFTGAKKGGKIGLFELAHNGTIFLDEIGDMEKGLQARLLRVLEERMVMRLGSDALIPVNIRVIAATNIDLRKQMMAGNFRNDLFFRLNVLNLPLLSLRERPDDIPLLAEQFFKRFIREHNKNAMELPQEMKRLICEYSWPGNIRELKNIMERIVLTAIEGEIHLPTVRLMVEELQAGPKQQAGSGNDELIQGTFRDIKRKIIRRVLQEEDWNKSQTARRLGIDRMTVDRFAELESDD
ncbi:sigma 54-interacting transcriptional regulator [Anaerospora sp.]|uniref:sigma 54-interacting transcriptional regulator n=1 Tax=Anaerospora sp. TaxID=1960278 RepID=UPI00289FA84F|nr:sigma 54-interacting transcriptional regulator [Anaerospora sp.]